MSGNSVYPVLVPAAAVAGKLCFAHVRWTYDPSGASPRSGRARKAYGRQAWVAEEASGWEAPRRGFSCSSVVTQSRRRYSYGLVVSERAQQHSSVPDRLTPR